MEFTGRTDLPYRYTIRDWLFSIGDITTTSYPFSAYYEYENNGNVYRTEYYNGSVRATYKRYRYSHTYDNLNRLTDARYYPFYSGAYQQPNDAHFVRNMTYDRNGNLKTLQRYNQNAGLIDNLTYTYTSGTNRMASVSCTTKGVPACTGILSACEACSEPHRPSSECTS
jgi:hypothetical protein